MKFYLFSFLLIFPFALAFGQVNGTVTNSNNNSNSNTIKLEKKASSTFNMEVQEEVLEAPQIESESTEDVSPVERTDNRSKDQVVSIDSQRATYIGYYNSYNQQRSQRSLTETQNDNMTELLRELASSHPMSFESYFFYYLNGQNDLKRSKALLKANEMKPADEMVQKEMMTYYVLVSKPDETRKAVLNLSQNGVYSNSTNAYGQDLINSVPQNSTLITHGKEDSYAALYAQKVKRERADVEILSLDWLTSPQYRLKLKASGWKLPSSSFVDTKYFEELCRINKDKRIAISMTLPKEYLLPILDKLYVSGLVFEYKDIPTDMSIRNEKLWNSTLNKELIETKETSLVNNYLPMLFQLKKVYEANGDTESVNKLDVIIKDITTK